MFSKRQFLQSLSIPRHHDISQKSTWEEQRREVKRVEIKALINICVGSSILDSRPQTKEEEERRTICVLF